MLKRIVKEAASGFSSGGERSSSSKKKGARRANSAQSSADDPTDKPRRRGRDTSDDDAERIRKRDETTTEDKPRSRNKTSRAKRASRKKREPLLEYRAVEIIHNAMRGAKKKRARQELLTSFAEYDPSDTGLVDDEKFKKCIVKVGIKLKSSDLAALLLCFRRGGGEDVQTNSESAPKERKSRSANTARVDYSQFIDFACNVKDSEKLSAIREKLRDAIDSYEGKQGPRVAHYSIFSDLKKLDKKKRDWIPSDRFMEFIEEHERPSFRLSSNDLSVLCDRFEYEYDKGELGVDYKQLSEWLQPTQHLDKEELHKRVKRLVVAAQSACGWELDEVFEAIDENGDGHITAAELQDALSEMGLPLTNAELTCLVDEYDADGDGKVQYREFVSLFQAPKEKLSRSTKRGEDESDTERVNEKPMKKGNVRNSFSWGITKAFARKHANKKGSSSAKKGEAMSLSDTQPRSRRTAKQRVIETDSESDGSIEEKREMNTVSKSKASRQSTSSPSSMSDTVWENEKRSRKAKTKTKSTHRRIAKSSSETDDTDRAKKSRREKLKKRSKEESTRKVESSDGEPSLTPQRATKHSRAIRGESASPRRRVRSQSTVSRRSHRGDLSKGTGSYSKRSKSQNQDSRGNSKRLSSHSFSSRRTQRIQSRRRKGSIGDSTSTAGSAGDSEGHDLSSSGLDLDQVRSLQREPRKKRKYRQNERGSNAAADFSDDGDDGDDDDTDSGKDNNMLASHSDAEYDRRLKKSLRRAFDFFDLDHSSTIEKRELGHVLRALGHEFTTAELDKEMERADMDKNGQLDFHEFVRFVKKQLSQKAFLLSKQREMEIRQAFQSLDTDKNGHLDEKEFEYLIYKVLQIELSVEEQDALLDFVDENGDGNINEEEFIAFMKAMEDFHKQGVMSKNKQRQMLENLDGVSRLACSAMKKLVRGAPIDLDKNLLMFFGIPSNFRPAITSTRTCRNLKENTMEHALSFPCPETIVCLAQDPVNTGLKKDTGLLGIGRKEDISDEATLLKQAESWESQAIVSLKRATGVPKPFDTREDDVVKRCVHVCLYQEQEERLKRSKGGRRAVGSKSPSATVVDGAGAIVGNVHEIPVYWKPQEEDVWEFSKKATKEDKYKFLVRTNKMNDKLFLLVEFIVHLRMADTGKASRRRGRRHLRGSSAGGDGKLKDSDGNELREMVSCWCKIPLRTLLAKRLDVFRIQEKLWGGTAIAPIDIEQDEILRRRTGWRAVTNAFRKPAPPVVGLKSVPLESLPEDVNTFVRKMPPLIIAPFISLPIVAEYMTAMQESLWLRSNVASATMCQPVLKLLPQIIDDHEALSVFRVAFDAEMNGVKSQEDRQKKFFELALRMWPSFIELLGQIPLTTLQDAKVPSSRRLSLLSPAGSGVPPQPSQGTLNEPPPAQQARSSLLQSSAQGRLRLRDVPIAAVPFHVREVTFERLI